MINDEVPYVQTLKMIWTFPGLYVSLSLRLVHSPEYSKNEI